MPLCCAPEGDLAVPFSHAEAFDLKHFEKTCQWSDRLSSATVLTPKDALI
jgi:hypothetical protein